MTFDFSALDAAAHQAAQAAFLASIPNLNAALTGARDVPVTTLRAAHAELRGRGVHPHVMAASAAQVTEWATRTPLTDTTAVSVFCLPPGAEVAWRLRPAVLLASDARAAHQRTLMELLSRASSGDRVILIGMHVRLFGELRAASGLYVTATLA